VLREHERGFSFFNLSTKNHARRRPKTLFNQCIQILTKIKLAFILNIFNNGRVIILQRSSFTRGGREGVEGKTWLLIFFVYFLRFFFKWGWKNPENGDSALMWGCFFLLLLYQRDEIRADFLILWAMATVVMVVVLASPNEKQAPCWMITDSTQTQRTDNQNSLITERKIEQRLTNKIGK